MDNKVKLLTELANELSPKYLKFANGLLEQKTQEQACIDAGYSKKTARSQSSRLLTNANIKKYLALSKQVAQESALEATTISEAQWLNTQKRVLAMSLGDETIQKHSFFMGKSVTAKVNEANLLSANKAQELIARRMGWLTDNKKIQIEPISFHIDLG